MRVICALHQLQREVKTIRRPRNRALQDSISPQLPRDFMHWTAHALVSHYRSSRYHAQRSALRQHRDEFIRHTVGEVVLGVISREIDQRQYRDGVDGLMLL